MAGASQGYFCSNVRAIRYVMIGRLRRSLYVGRITEYLFRATFVSAITTFDASKLVSNLYLTTRRNNERGDRLDNKGTHVNCKMISAHFRG